MANARSYGTATFTFRELAQRLRKPLAQVLTPQTMAAVGGVVEAATLDRMEREVDVDGRPLAPLDPKYRRWKQYGTTSARLEARRAAQREKRLAAGKRAPVWKSKRTRRRVGGYSAKIWQLTGASKRRLRTIEITATGCKVQINTPYSGYVQEGTDDMPPRPVLGVSEQDWTEIEAVVMNDLERTVL